MKPKCLKCKVSLQSVRTANSRYNKTIPNVAICPECLSIYRIILKKIK